MSEERKIKQVKKTKLIVPIIILIIGVLLILSPWIKNMIVANTSKVDSSLTAEQFEKNNKNSSKNDYDAVKRLSTTSVFNNSMKVDKNAIIGEIKINSVDLYLPIHKGTNDANLLGGATTMLEEQKMGEGNYSLAGHHMRDSSLLFGPLLEIKKGADIVITNKKKDFHYKVVETKIVDETDIDILDDKGDKRITLFTCDTADATSKRFVVIGTLDKVTKHK